MDFARPMGFPGGSPEKRVLAIDKLLDLKKTWPVGDQRRRAANAVM
jgi:hypothetical protein